MLHCIVTAVNKTLAEPIDYISCATATEMAPSRQNMLKQFSNNHGPQCVFGQAEERLLMKAWNEIQQKLPKTDDLLGAKKLAHQQIQGIIAKAYDEEWEECFQAPCTTHGKCCPVIGKYEKDKWSLIGSGVVCKDASRIGARQGDGGAAMPGQTAWG